jgi:hypothetical protein
LAGIVLEFIMDKKTRGSELDDTGWLNCAVDIDSSQVPSGNHPEALPCKIPDRLYI